MREGWKCPVCGRGVAPTEKTCDHDRQGAAGIDTEPLEKWRRWMYPRPQPYGPWPYIVTCEHAPDITDISYKGKQ